MIHFSTFASALLVLLVTVGGNHAATAATQALNLQLLPTDATSNRLDITVSTNGLSDSDLTRASGNALATIGYDLYLGEPLVHSIEFTGGRVLINGSTTSDINFNLGNVFFGVDIVGAGLSGTLDTPSPPGSVMNGSFSLAEHQLRVDAGTLDATGRGLLSAINTSINLNQDPLDLVTEGTALIDVVETGTAGRVRTYDVTLTLPVDAQELITDPTTITVDVSGLLIASDTFAVTFPVEGDYNGDQRVDHADYTVWRDALGASGPGQAADGNFDWVVDEQDYTLWQVNFGEVAASTFAATTTSAPEPSGLWLLAIAAAALRLR